MNKNIIGLYLRFILFIQFVPLIVGYLCFNYLTIIKHTTGRFSYLSDVKGSPQEITSTLQVLGDFHAADGSNSKIPGLGWRPITITYIDDFIQNEFAVDGVYLNGLAHVKWGSCDITISRARTPSSDRFIRTLIHEYLHCFGYKHIDNRHDIMYPYQRPTTKESLKAYSKDLNKRLR
jgi:hypothetical protein